VVIVELHERSQHLYNVHTVGGEGMNQNSWNSRRRKKNGGRRPSTIIFVLTFSPELHVRERGKFWLRNIYLTSPSIKQLKSKINEYVPHPEGSYLHSMYELWSRSPIVTDADVAKLTPKVQISIKVI
jgi:hypothetical protein